MKITSKLQTKIRILKKLIDFTFREKPNETSASEERPNVTTYFTKFLCACANMYQGTVRLVFMVSLRILQVFSYVIYYAHSSVSSKYLKLLFIRVFIETAKHLVG